MAVLEKEAVRATVTFGDIIVKTPWVMSFEVQRSRGQMISTCSASLKIDANLLQNTTSSVRTNLIIEAGKAGNEHLIFTGIVSKLTINPNRTDSSKVIVSLSGKDVMYVMEGIKINRRTKTYRDGSSPPARYGVITGIFQDNAPVRAGFQRSMYSANLAAVYLNKEQPITYAPAAYSELDRSTSEAQGSLLVGNPMSKADYDALMVSTGG